MKSFHIIGSVVCMSQTSHHMLHACASKEKTITDELVFHRPRIAAHTCHAMKTNKRTKQNEQTTKTTWPRRRRRCCCRRCRAASAAFAAAASPASGSLLLHMCMRMCACVCVLRVRTLALALARGHPHFAAQPRRAPRAECHWVTAERCKCCAVRACVCVFFCME